MVLVCNCSPFGSHPAQKINTLTTGQNARPKVVTFYSSNVAFFFGSFRFFSVRVLVCYCHGPVLSYGSTFFSMTVLPGPNITTIVHATCMFLRLSICFRDYPMFLLTSCSCVWALCQWGYATFGSCLLDVFNISACIL